MKNEILEVCKTNKLSKEKTTEIVGMMSTLVEKYSDWEEKSKVVINDEEDVENMAIARTNRLSIKKDRGEAEKYIKSKRTEVQAKMAEYTAEDKTLLKISQLVESKAKSIEADLEQKEKYADIKKAERIQRLVEERKEKLFGLTEDPEIYPLDTMSDIAFETTLESLIALKEKKEQEEKIQKEIEKKAEEDRLFLTQLQNKRLDIALLTGNYGPSWGVPSYELYTLTEESFQELVKLKTKAKDEYLEEQKEATKRQLEQEQLLEKKRGEENLLLKRQKEEAALKKAPAKEQLLSFLNTFSYEEVKVSEDAVSVYKDIISKFNGFKKWAEGEIDKL